MEFMNKPSEMDELFFDTYCYSQKEILRNKLYNDKLNNATVHELLSTVHEVYKINSLLLDANKISVRQLQDEQNELLDVALSVSMPEFTEHKQKCDFDKVTVKEALNIIDDALTYGFTFVVESGNIYASYLK